MTSQRRTSSNTTIFSFWKYANSYDIEPRFLGLSSDNRYSAQMGYGWIDNDALEWTAIPSISTRQLGGEDPAQDKSLPHGALYSDFLSSRRPFSFRIDLPMEPFRFTFIFADRAEKTTDHGPLQVSPGRRGGSDLLKEGISVPAGKVVYYQTDRNVRGSWVPLRRVHSGATPGGCQWAWTRCCRG